jgi:antitoxin component YwqK of YwqJK toxin-antitoxin module
MNKMLSNVMLLVVLVLFGCGPKLEEVVMESYDDGTPKIIRYYKGEGKEKTMVKEGYFYPDGQIRMEGEYLHGVKHGLWVSYYQDGTKWSEGHYIDGINNGTTTTWHENGQKYYEGFYKNGERAGIWKFWAEDGAFLKEIDYGPYAVEE